ncbi:MAG: DUF1640 domain-containing protein [Magnetococcales bacterium]|nr:DUF1640 domain-containing protein [Magnetococcales bacterium]
MMTTAVAFDTHKFVRRLREAGVEERQAEAFSDAFQEVQEAQLEELATKSDLAELRNELKGEIRELRGEIQRQGESTSREFKRQEESFKRDIREFRLEVEARLQKFAGEALLVRWMLGFLLAGVISIILKLFMPS